MNYKNHLAFGSAAAIATPAIMHYSGFNLNTNQIAVIIASVIAGSLYSDCDTASIPSRIYAILGAITSVLFYAVGMNNMIAILWIPFIMAKMSSHRGWTHSWFLPIGLIVVPFIIFMFTIDMPRFQHLARLMYEYRLVFLGFSIGILVHKILDTTWFRKFAIAIGIHKP